MTPEITRELVTALSTVLKEYVGRELTALETRLTARVEALEARPIGLKYCGVWRRGESYGLHDGVSHGGGVWVCKADNVVTQPGHDPVGWQLAVKSGRDGKDGKDLR